MVLSLSKSNAKSYIEAIIRNIGNQIAYEFTTLNIIEVAFKVASASMFGSSVTTTTICPSLNNTPEIIDKNKLILDVQYIVELREDTLEEPTYETLKYRITYSPGVHLFAPFKLEIDERV